MSEIRRPCWQCEYPDCGHAWLKDPENPNPPIQCAKCRRRGWHTPPPGCPEPAPSIQPLQPSPGPVVAAAVPLPVDTAQDAAPYAVAAPGGKGGPLRRVPRPIATLPKVGEKCPHNYAGWLKCPICNPKAARQ